MVILHLQTLVSATILLALPLQVSAQSNPLGIPPLLEGPTYDLTLQPSTHNFYDGVATDTYAFNGTYLGPTLVLNKGEDIQLNVTNTIGEPTTVHWHGMHVSPQNDGGPHTVIEDGETWSPAFTVLNQATTMWYHPHLHMNTDEHAYRGLAGLIIIRDDEEAALDLPRTYGVDDIPLVLQDRDFDEQGQLVFRPMDIGAGGDVMVINGTVDPILEAPAQVVRFRALNGSGARVYNIGLSDNRTFHQIGSDGGLLEAPAALNRIRLSSGERAEFLVDFSGEVGDTLAFVSYSSELINGEPGGADEPLRTNPLNGTDFDFLTVKVVAPTTTPTPITTLPGSLVSLSPIPEVDAVRTRTMTLDGGTPGVRFSINGITLDLDVINEVVYLGDTEIWEISNVTTSTHPFHMHDVQFYILDRDGVPPPDNEKGLKDVVFVYAGETVRVITRFEDFADPVVPFMYHCHFFGHEDRGMMGQFIVIDRTSGVDDGQVDGESITLRNYPNPFSRSTTLQYGVSERTDLRIEVFDLLGQRVKVVFDGVRQAGTYEAIWKAGELAAGTYIVRLTTPSESFARRVTLSR